MGLRITLTEQADGWPRFDLVNEGEQVADLRGLFFDTVDAGLLSGLTVVGADVTRSVVGDDAVTNLGDGVNMNGVGAFDVGITFGTAGIGKDDIGDTSFTLRSSNGPLELEDSAGVDFGVRFTSVGDADGTRDGSSELFGGSPDAPIVLPPELPPLDPALIFL